MIFEQESEQLFRQVHYSRILDSIINSIESSLKELELNICELDDKSFPESEIVTQRNKILEKISHEKIEFDKRISENQRHLEELFNFCSIEYPFEWNPPPYFLWVIGVLLFALLFMNFAFSLNNPQPTDYKREEPKPSIVPFTNK